MIFEVATTKKIIEDCKVFSEACVKTNQNLYKNRNQRNLDKITEDIFNGKLGEYGAYDFLKSKGFIPENLPDIQVYSKRKKSFNADLKIGDVPVHVKCQSLDSANKYGMSWTFQYGGRINTGNKKRNHHDPLIDSPDGIIIFCTVGELEGTRLPRVWIHAALPAKLCIPDMLELPKLDYLKQYKRVVYYDTLKKKISNLCDLPK